MYSIKHDSLPPIAVLVLNYNGYAYLADCFDSLSRQSYPHSHPYLVDNGSTDQSIAFTRAKYPQVTIISLSHNFGFAEAYNRAVDQVNEPFVVFLNNDTRCQEDWLEQLYAPFHNHPMLAATGSRMVFAAAPDIINHGGGYFTLTGIGLDRDFGRSVQHGLTTSDPFPTSYACGGAMLIKRELFLQVGGFDPEYFIYFEDVDLAWRLWSEGWQIFHVPTSLVYHYFSPVFGQESATKIYLCQKNRLANMVKHFQVLTLIKAMIISLLYDTQRTIMWVRGGEIALATAVFRGTLAFCANLPRLLYQRGHLKRHRLASDRWFRQQNLLLPLRQSLQEMKRLRAVKQTLFR